MSRKMSMVAVLAILLVVPVALSMGFNESQRERGIHLLAMKPEEIPGLVSDPSFRAINSLKEYSLYTVDLEDLLQEAKKGVLPLEIRGRKFELVLTPDTRTLLPGATKRPIYTFRGSVKGIPESKVALTVSDRALFVTIWVPGEWYYLRSTKTKLNGRPVVIGYSSKDKLFKNLSYRDEVIKTKKENIHTNQNTNSKNTMSLHGGLKSIEPFVFPSEPVYITIELVAGYDPEFEQISSDPESEVINIMASVNDIFEKYGIYFQINTIKEFYVDGNDACEALSDFSPEAQEAMDIYSADLSFLFSGKVFSNGVIGCAYQYRGRVAVGQMNSDGYGFNRVYVATHELGHTLDADHEEKYPEEIEGYNHAYSWYYWQYHTTFYTIMWSSAPDEYKWPEFSDKYNHGDEIHDNARRIKETAPIVAGYN